MAEAGPSTSRMAGNGEHKSRHNMTPAEQQAANLERLLANPDREVHLPKVQPKEKSLRAPRETMKNVSGSSAGAGSGEFHIYKHARRREYERIKLMEDKADKEKQSSHFLIQQAQQAAKDDAKTDKNRAKRDKKKLAKERAKLAAKSGAEGTDQPQTKRKRGDDPGGQKSQTAEQKVDKKIKAAPGSEGIKFQSKDQDDDSDDASDADE